MDRPFAGRVALNDEIRAGRDGFYCLGDRAGLGFARLLGFFIYLYNRHVSRCT